MRAAAVALVLAVGAAVVLWFGNTLNSWVLGGLIGGLAALLLSIPISLALFSFLARRQDERLRAAEQEQEEIARSYEYQEEFVEEVYDAEAYELAPEQVTYEEMKVRRMQAAQGLQEIRGFPASSSYAQLPAAGQSQASASSRTLAQQRSILYPATPRQQSQALPAARGKDTRLAMKGRTHYPGFPGYQANSMRARQQTEALRAAQREAEQQYYGMEVLPTPTSQMRRLPGVRPSQSLEEQPARPGSPRPARQLPEQMANQYPRRRVIEAAPAQQTGLRRPLPAAGESSVNRSSSTDALRIRKGELQTDQLHGSNGYYPQTGQLHRQFQRPQTQQTQQAQRTPRTPHPDQIDHNARQQTGQIVRNPQIDEQRRNPEIITGSLKNPLLRRAPYMYEDDPLRQELARQIDTPAVRRSSRFAEKVD